MYLVASTLADVVEQRFKIASSRRIACTRVSIWLYLNDVQDTDTFIFDLENETINSSVFSIPLTGAEIKASLNATDTYSHGKLFLDPGFDVRLGRGNYVLRGYQQSGFGPMNFASWCREWEAQYFSAVVAPVGDWQDAHYLRIYDKEGRQL